MIAIFNMNSTITSGNALGLLFELVILIINFWAISRIIGQAGYSRSWILVPLLPLALTVIAIFVVFHDLSSGFYGESFGVASIDTIGAIWLLDLFSIFVNWIFFLIFAFSTWPVATQNYVRYARPAPPAPGGNPVRGTTPPRPPTAPSFGGADRRPAPPVSPLAGTPQNEKGISTPGPTNQSPTVAPTVQYCQWCGKEQADDALAIHHCGPKTRPAAFCTKCGTPLSPGSSTCVSCDEATFSAPPPPPPPPPPT